MAENKDATFTIRVWGLKNSDFAFRADWYHGKVIEWIFEQSVQAADAVREILEGGGCATWPSEPGVCDAYLDEEPLLTMSFDRLSISNLHPEDEIHFDFIRYVLNISKDDYE